MTNEQQKMIEDLRWRWKELDDSERAFICAFGRNDTLTDAQCKTLSTVWEYLHD